MIGLILGVGLVIAGTWTGLVHKHHLTPDLQTVIVVAIVLGGILIVAWIGGLLRFLQAPPSHRGERFRTCLALPAGRAESSIHFGVPEPLDAHRVPAGRHQPGFTPGCLVTFYSARIAFQHVRVHQTAVISVNSSRRVDRDQALQSLQQKRRKRPVRV